MNRGFFGCENIKFRISKINNEKEFEIIKSNTVNHLPFVNALHFPIIEWEEGRVDSFGKMKKFTYKLFIHLIQKSIHLHRFSLQEQLSRKEIEELTAIMKSMKIASNIYSIELGNGFNSSKEFELFKNIRYLQITEKDFMDDFVSKKFKSLQELKILKTIKSFSNQFAKKILDLPSIQTLDLRVEWKSANREFLSTLKTIPNLKIEKIYTKKIIVVVSEEGTRYQYQVRSNITFRKLKKVYASKQKIYVDVFMFVDENIGAIDLSLHIFDRDEIMNSLDPYTIYCQSTQTGGKPVILLYPKKKKTNQKCKC